MTPMSTQEVFSIEFECSKLVISYAYFTDNRLYEEQANLFTEDAIYINPFKRAEGKKAIRCYLEHKNAGNQIRHICCPPFFESVHTDQAISVTYATIFVGEDKGEGSIEVSGADSVVEFHHIFQRTPAGWRIAQHTSRPVVVVKPQ